MVEVKSKNGLFAYFLKLLSPPLKIPEKRTDNLIGKVLLLYLAVKMKLIKRILLISVLSGVSSLIFAEPSFSGMTGGTTGLGVSIPKSGDTEWTVPVSGFLLGQISFTDWLILRAGIEIRAKNFQFDDIFDGADATVKMQEVSLVMINRAVTATNYFSIFMGAYEPIGGDTFLQRQFGIEPISSRLMKSSTSLSGISLYPSSGTGLSYTVHFDKQPVATGAYIYIDKDSDKNMRGNIDWRFAILSNPVTLDFSIGVGAPLQDKYNDEDVVLMIKTLYLHGGINLCFGNKYTNGLLLQFGINDFVLKGASSGNFDNDSLSFVIEPRLNFGNWCLNITAYAIDEKSLGELLYLTDRIGAAVTVFKDSIQGKNGNITAGLHAIGSVGNIKFMDLAEGKNTDDMTVNAYLTPYTEIPLGSGSEIEVMAQVGAKNITKEPEPTFKVIAGFKKKF